MFPNLKLQLWRVGLRQNRLARLLGLDEPALSKIVNGYRQPTAELREKIAMLLHSDERWLFEQVNDEPVWSAPLRESADAGSKSG